MKLSVTPRTRWWLLAGVIAIVVCLPQRPQLDWLYQSIWELTSGWVRFPIRSLSHADCLPGRIAAGFGYAAALIAGSHLFLRWVYRQATGGRRWRFAWTTSAAGVMLMMFVSGVAAVGLFRQAEWLAAVPASAIVHSPDGERWNRRYCQFHLYEIGLAIILYQQDHAGRYPDDFATLLSETKIRPEEFICPSSVNDGPASGTTPGEVLADFAKPHHCSYMYYGKGLVDPVDPKRVIAAEPLSNHDGDGINVLYGDGHVDWLPHDDAAKLLAKLMTTQPTTRATR